MRDIKRRVFSRKIKGGCLVQKDRLKSQAQLKRIPVVFIILFEIIYLSSCSGMRKVSDTRIIENNLAKDIFVVVLEPASFKYGLVTYTLPAGNYLPFFEDVDGIYFKSPSKLSGTGGLSSPFFKKWIFGPHYRYGGLFIQDGDPRKIRGYVTEKPIPRSLDICMGSSPENLQFRIEIKK